jgi:subfamily B ATP-binding cassette protein MsbA
MYDNYKILKEFVSKHKIAFSAYIIILAIEMPTEAIGFSNYTLELINGAKENDLKKISKAIGLISAIYIFTKGLSIAQTYVETKLYHELASHIRKYMFSAFLKYYTDKYQEIEIGTIIAKLNNIPHIYQNMMDEMVRAIVPYTIAMIVLNGYFWYINSILGFTISIFIVGLFIIIVKLSMSTIDLELNRQDMYYNLNNNIQDKLSNLYSIITNNTNQIEQQKIEKHEKDYVNISLKYENKYLLCDTYLNLWIFALVIVVFGIYYFIFKTDKSDKITKSFMTFFYIVKYANSMKSNLLDFLSKFGILRNLEKSFVHNASIFKGGDAKDFITNGNIRFEKVSFKYENKTIHSNLNLAFNQGKTTLILGKSGTGKTTILKMILGLYDYGGNIYIDNVELREADLKYLRNNISVIDQNNVLFNTTIYDNIKYGNETIVTNKTIDQIVSNLNIDILPDLNTNVGVNGSNLSNGQRQIVMLLRGLIKNTKIIIFDEPTSALDEMTKQKLFKVLTKIKENKTIIIVTHDDSINAIADETIKLT